MSRSGLTIGSVFAGIGGLDLGLSWSGHGPVLWQIEIDPLCQKVLRKHWPEARRYHDIREIRGEDLEPVSIICGGFPCQNLSSAGKRDGLSGARSGLWYEMLRLVKSLRPPIVVVENVISGATRWYDTVSEQRVGRTISTLELRGDEKLSQAISNTSRTSNRQVVSWIYHPSAVEKITEYIEVSTKPKLKPKRSSKTKSKAKNESQMELPSK